METAATRPEMPGFRDEAMRQSRLVARRPDAEDVMDFLERISILDDDDASPGATAEPAA